MNLETVIQSEVSQKEKKYHILTHIWASLVAWLVKNPPAMQEIPVGFLGREDPLEEGHGNPLQYSCLENPHGQRSLAGYSPWGLQRVGPN